MYAGRKRRKPVQRGAKPVPVDGTKTNPSKRHRERLNSELERLAGLLPFPQEVTSSLDKLSILRLSVSFLRSKSFFSVALKNQPSNGSTVNTAGHENGKTTGSDDGSIPEGELLLQALNGFVLVVTADGVIFFSSHTIQEYLGFQQTDVMYQSVFELIHSEDQLEFRRNLHWALDPSTSTQPGETETEQVSTSSPVTYDPQHIPPENSSFLERGFVCRFRCLLDNSSGFLAMNVQGRLKYLHGQNLRQRQADGQPSNAPPRLALFAIASPLQTPAILEIRTRNLIFRTKHKLDFTPMACDAKGKMVLGYTEAELRVRGSGYQFIHAADMLYCAENHIRMIKTGESGLTVFRLLTKENRWKWVQANARLVYKNGKPDYIIATQRPLVEEEGGEHLRKRSLHLPFTFATGEALLYHTSFPLHGFPDPHQAKTKAKGGKAKRGRQDRSSKDELDPNSLLGAVMSQDESVYVCEPAAVTKTSFHGSLFSEQGAGSLAGWRGDTGWNMSTNESEGDSKVSGYDPLLSTLDSLSLDGDETCSNSELFSALESLGLEAEDLELLLLDKRMVQVELDPGHIPTLSDLLTNNEILSFVHDSLEGSSGAGDTGGGVGSGPPDLTVQSSAGHQPGPQLTGSPHLSQFQTPTISRQRRQPPIVKLSQQMHQHINATQLAKAPPWAGHISLSQPGTINPNPLAGVHNSHWQENHFNSHEHTNSLQAQPVASVSQLNSENKHLSQLLASKQPWQVQKDLMLLHIQAQNQRPEADTDLLWSGYRNPHGADLQNGHAPFSQVPLNGTNSTAGLNSAIIPNVSLCQGTVLATSANQPPSHHKHQQVLSTSLTELPVQNQSVDLEQFLVLSQPPCSMPSLEACGMFNTTVNHDGAASKENNCIISTSNAAYLRSCLLPNGNGVASTDVPVQDPQKAGFFSLAGAQLRLPE